MLIVDDNEDLVEMLSLIVSDLGHDVRKALDGGSALDAARAYRPDLEFRAEPCDVENARRFVGD